MFFSKFNSAQKRNYLSAISTSLGNSFRRQLMPCEDASACFFEILDEVLEFCYYDHPEAFDKPDEEAHIRYVYSEVETAYLIRISNEARAIAKHRLRASEFVRFEWTLMGALHEWYKSTKKIFYRQTRTEAADLLYSSVLAAVQAEQNDEASLCSFRIDVSDIIAKAEVIHIVEPAVQVDDGDWRLKWHVAKDRKIKKKTAAKRVETAAVTARDRKLSPRVASNTLKPEERKKICVPVLLGTHRNKNALYNATPEKSFEIPTVREIERAQRERIQRLSRRRKDALLLKDVPKRAREAAIKKQRDKRTPVLQSGLVKDGYGAIFAGLLAAGAISAGAAYVGYSAYKKYKRAEARALEVVSQCKKAADEATGIFAAAKSIVEKVRAAIDSDFWIVPIIVAAAYFAYYYPGGMAVAILTLAISRFMPAPIWKELKFFFTGIRRQDGNCEMIGRVLAVVCTFSCLRNFNSFYNPYLIGELAKRMTSLPKMCEGWSSLAEWTIGCVEVGINWILSFFSPARVKLLNSKRSVLDDWCFRVDQEVKNSLSKDFTISNPVLDGYVQLIAEGYDLREVYRGTPLMRTLADCLAKVTDLLRPHQGALNARKNFRVEPEFILMRGAPGIGKTVMTAYMASHIMVASGLLDQNDPEAVKGNIFQKGSSPYWNGYSGQITLIKDDAYQLVKQETAEENEFLSDIRAISSWSYPLNFADLDSKGKIYFTSQLIIGTTNRDNLEHARDSIYEPEAVYRRIGHPYTLELREHYRDGAGRLDWTKYEEQCKLLGPGHFPWHMWIMKRHDFKTGVTSELNPKEVLDVLNEVAARLRKKNAEHKDCENSLAEYIRAMPTKAMTQEEYTTMVLQKAREKAEKKKEGLLNDILEARGISDKLEPLEAEDMKVFGLASKLNMKVEDFRALLAAYKVKESESPAAQAQPGASYEAAMAEIEAYTNDDDEPHLQAGPEVVDGEARWKAFMDENLKDVIDEGEREDTEWLASEAIKVTYANTKDMRFRQAAFAWYFKMAVEIGRFALGLWLCWKAVKFLFSTIYDLVAKAVDHLNPFSKKDYTSEQQSNRPIGKANPNAIERQSNLTPIIHNVYDSGYKMVCVGDIKDVLVGTVTFVGDNLAVYPTHFDDTISRALEQGMKQLRFVSANKPEFHFMFPIETFQSFRRFQAADEVTFIEFGQVRSHKRIVGNFIKEDDLKAINGRQCKMPVCDVTIGNKFMPGYDVGRSMMNSYEISKPLYKPRGVQCKTFKLDRVIEYCAATENGDCGSPLCLVDSSRFNGRTVIGYHVAGSANGTAYSVPVTQELIAKAEAYFGTIKDEFFEDATDRGIQLQSGDDEFFGPGSFQAIGRITDGPNLNPNSKFYKTEYYGCLGPVDLTPAHQRPVMVDEQLVYPMLNAIAPYNTPVTHYLPGDWETTVYSAMIPFTACSKANTRMVFDFETAVLGDPRLGYFRSVPRGTAPGFPYCLEKKPGKKEYLGYGDVYDLQSPKALELKARVEYIIDQARSNTRLCHIFVDFLKDELRPARKNDLVQTRLISSSPMDYTIAFRMMFGAFMNAVMQHHVHCGMAPGICTYTEWEVLWTALTVKGDKVIAGDFKSFDSSLQPPVLWAILDFINEWYDDGVDNKRIRRILWCDLVHSRHVGGNGTDQVHVYQWNKSLPSGHPFTTVVNSMYSLTMLVAAVSKLVRKDTSYFWQICAAVTYGDDNVLNVCDSVAPLITQVALGQVMGDFGMKYTSDDKTAELGSHSSMDCITFLKRSFKKKGKTVVCPSDLDSFLYTFYYGKNKKLHAEIMVSVMENALEELSMHEDHVWAQHAPKIYEALSKRVVPRFPCRQQAYLNAVLMRSDNWY